MFPLREQKECFEVGKVYLSVKKINRSIKVHVNLDKFLEKNDNILPTADKFKFSSDFSDSKSQEKLAEINDIYKELNVLLEASLQEMKNRPKPLYEFSNLMK